MSKYTHIDYRYAIKLSAFENYIRSINKRVQCSFIVPLSSVISVYFLWDYIEETYPTALFLMGDANVNCSKEIIQRHTEAAIIFCLEGYKFPLPLTSSD